jgi:hypothetical protein
MSTLKRLMPYLMMASMMGGFLPKAKDELADIDIEYEYRLIQEKKSRLSRNMRDMVVYRYEKIMKDRNTE